MYTLLQKLNTIYKQLSTETSPLQIPLSLYTSNHPFQHKYAAIRYLHNILHTYQLHSDEYNHEINFTCYVLHNTSFPIQPLRLPKIKHKQTTDSEIPTYKLATFTYKGKETTYITKIFKHSNLEIAYPTNNSIKRT